MRKIIRLLFMYSSLIFCVSCNNPSDLIPVKSGEKWGFINAKGKYEISPQFNNADPFSDGLALITSPSGKIAFIEKKGQYEVLTQYTDATAYGNSLAFAVDNEGYLICIDKTGKMRFNLNTAKSVTGFSDGLAAFGIEDENGHMKVGFYNTTGKIVVLPQYEDVHTFSEGLAAVKKDEKWAFINTNGNCVIAPQFDSVSGFINKKSVAYIGKLAGYIDRKGKIVINPQFDAARIFSEGLAAVKMGKKWGFIDYNGKIVVNPQFEDVKSFSDGLAAVRMDKKWGYINKKGKIQINPQFDGVKPFNNNVALVKFSGKWGLINRKGEYVVNPQFDDVKLEDCIPKVIFSSYYDASAFIKSFFRKAGRNTFDGFGENFSLKKIKHHPLYQNLRAGNKYMAYADKNQRFSDEISISTTKFHFAGYIYNTRTKYEDEEYYDYYYGWRSRRVPHNYTCFYDEKLSVIEYPFILSGEAKEKSSVIANALKNKIEDFYGINFEQNEKNDFYEAYPDENGKLSFGIKYDQGKLSLFVGFQSDKLRELLNKKEADGCSESLWIDSYEIYPVSEKNEY